MLIPHSTPVTKSDTGISIAGFVLVTTLAGLKDGRPGGLTILAWPVGTQTTATVATIDVGFNVPIKPRVAGVIGIEGLPVGLRCKIGWAVTQGGAADQNEQESTVTANISGDRIVYDAWPAGLAEAWGVRYTFFNDVAGATAIASGAEITIGELWASDALDLDAGTGGEFGHAGGTIVELSVSGQPFDALAEPRQTLRVPGLWEWPDKAFFDPDSVARARRALAKAPRTLITPYETPIADAREGAFYARFLGGNQRGLPASPRLIESDWQFEELRP